MSPAILLHIEKIIDEAKLLNPTQLKKLVGLLTMFKKGEIIYPGVLIRKLKIRRATAYDVLERIRNAGLIQLNYELYCHECNQFEGTIYETINSIPEEIPCEKCGDQLTAIKNALVIYKVLNDGSDDK